MKQSGFTFVEALIALFVLTISLAGSVGLMSWMVRANAYSSRLTTAVTVAQDKMDELLDQRYSQVASGSDVTSIFNRSWTVTHAAGSKAVDISVQWNDHDGNARQIGIATMIYKDMLGGY